MSTVGSYVLHLYCDYPDCQEGYLNFYVAFQEFVGRSESECLREARKVGWVINKRKEGELHGGFHARCPVHARKG